MSGILEMPTSVLRLPTPRELDAGSHFLSFLLAHSEGERTFKSHVNRALLAGARPRWVEHVFEQTHPDSFDTYVDFLHDTLVHHKIISSRGHASPIRWIISVVDVRNDELLCLEVVWRSWFQTLGAYTPVQATDHFLPAA